MRVLDAGIWRPVPHATQLLADLGATVLKLEPPGGDPMRQFPELFAGVATGKRSVTVDLKTAEGRALALRCAADADVFTEGWRPGVAARLGVGYDDVRSVNPSIVYASLSGYGQDGPLATLPGHDLNYQAFAGALATRAGGAEPRIPILPVADLAGATMLALEVCAAWAHRQRTGEGCRIDVSMTDVVAAWRGPRAGTLVAGRDESQQGSAGYGTFRCADGEWITLAVISEDHFWAAVCDVLGLGAQRALTYPERLQRADALNGEIAAAIARRERGELLDAFFAAGAPVAPVLTPEEAATRFRSEHPHGPVPAPGEHAPDPWGS
jgi:crotonobetainyl-CoA:carnitine CoA-transferase CaiB-like acyl-CoA transferase